MTLLSVDPGISACGCAAWDERGRLVAARLVRSPLKASAPVAERVGAMAYEVVKGLACANHLVVEYPRTYGGRAARGDANDLILEALVSGALVARSPISPLLRTLVLPQEWKGSAPKEVTRERALLDLSAEEVERVQLPARSLQHNVWDAVGIGLWWLKKQRVRR